MKKAKLRISIAMSGWNYKVQSREEQEKLQGRRTPRQGYKLGVRAFHDDRRHSHLCCSDCKFGCKGEVPTFYNTAGHLPLCVCRG